MSRLTFLLFSSALLMLFVLPKQVSAFGVQPALTDLVVQKNTTRVERLTVINPEKVERTIFVTLQGFEEGVTPGAPIFLREPALDHCVHWMSVPKNLRVPASSRAQIPVTITIPDTAPLSTCQVGVIVSRAPLQGQTETSAGVTVDAAISSLFFLTVDGAQNNNRIGAGEVTWPASESLVNTVSGDVVITLQNQGSAMVLPHIEIRVTDLFGRTLRHESLNAKQERLVVGSTRTFVSDHASTSVSSGWRDRVSIGPLTWHLVVRDQYDRVLFEKMAKNWLLPWVMMGVFVALVVGIVGLTVTHHRRLRV